MFLNLLNPLEVTVLAVRLTPGYRLQNTYFSASPIPSPVTGYRRILLLFSPSVANIAFLLFCPSFS